jgi:hypothetical protein
MKRSEMISKIASVIINHNDNISHTPRNKALEIATVILDFQEELGMGPVKVLEKKILRDMECMPYEDIVEVAYWEKE